jgi:hypothetical protein
MWTPEGPDHRHSWTETVNVKSIILYLPLLNGCNLALHTSLIPVAHLWSSFGSCPGTSGPAPGLLRDWMLLGVLGEGHYTATLVNCPRRAPHSSLFPWGQETRLTTLERLTGENMPLCKVTREGKWLIRTPWGRKLISLNPKLGSPKSLGWIH